MKYTVGICVMALSIMAEAQSIDTLKKKAVEVVAKPLRYNLSDDGSLYFQATLLNQTWARFNESNHGTTVNGVAAPETFDIGLRRTRIQLFGQISPKTFLYFQFGMNNFNFLSQNGGPPNQNVGNRKVAAFFHDAICEYKVSKGNQLKLGGGLTIANGLSRFSQPSIGTIMTMDVPVFAQATVDQNDMFSRKLSIYARGQFKKFDYRFVLSDPFVYRTSGNAPTLGSNATFAGKQHHKQYQAYVAYQFFEHEGHNTPYMTGTYLGKKKVWNIAAGIIHQKNAMWYTNSNDTAYQDMTLWCVESYLDMPINKARETAISAYFGFFKYNFGKNYLRYNGLMNPADGTQSSNVLASNAYGNSYPMMGTGKIAYAQIGYLLPKLERINGQLLPYASAMVANYDRIGKTDAVYDLGCTWLINGHQSKLSLAWQNRPTFKLSTSGGVESDLRKSALILQYQLFI